MSDNTALRGLQDRNRIMINEAYEMRCWPERFVVSQEGIATVITEVGTSVTMEEKYWKLRGHKAS